MRHGMSIRSEFEGNVTDLMADKGHPDAQASSDDKYGPCEHLDTCVNQPCLRAGEHSHENGA